MICEALLISRYTIVRTIRGCGAGNEDAFIDYVTPRKTCNLKTRSQPLNYVQMHLSVHTAFFLSLLSQIPVADTRQLIIIIDCRKTNLYF